jgi:hypothetical protein
MKTLGWLVLVSMGGLVACAGKSDDGTASGDQDIKSGATVSEGGVCGKIASEKVTINAKCASGLDCLSDGNANGELTCQKTSPGKEGDVCGQDGNVLSKCASGLECSSAGNNDVQMTCQASGSSDGLAEGATCGQDGHVLKKCKAPLKCSSAGNVDVEMTCQ